MQNQYRGPAQAQAALTNLQATAPHKNGTPQQQTAYHQAVQHTAEQLHGNPDADRIITPAIKGKPLQVKEVRLALRAIDYAQKVEKERDPVLKQDAIHDAVREEHTNPYQRANLDRVIKSAQDRESVSAERVAANGGVKSRDIQPWKSEPLPTQIADKAELRALSTATAAIQHSGRAQTAQALLGQVHKALAQTRGGADFEQGQ